MRRVKRHRREVLLIKCAPAASPTGVVNESEQAETVERLSCGVYPIDQRAWRDYRTLRPLERRLFIPDGFPKAAQGDRLRVTDENKVFRVTEVRRYPLHVEMEGEAMP